MEVISKKSLKDYFNSMNESFGESNNPEEDVPDAPEKFLSFNEYKRAAYDALKTKNHSQLSKALEGMYRVGTTEEEMVKIIDYIELPGTAFERMVLEKRDRIKNDSTNKAAQDISFKINL